MEVAVFRNLVLTKSQKKSRMSDDPQISESKSEIWDYIPKETKCLIKEDISDHPLLAQSRPYCMYVCILYNDCK